MGIMLMISGYNRFILINNACTVVPNLSNCELKSYKHPLLIITQQQNVWSIGLGDECLFLIQLRTFIFDIFKFNC